MFTDVSRSDVAYRVKKIVAAQLHVSKEELENDASYIGDLGADSLEVTQIMMLIEDEFWITFPETPVTDLSTVGRTVDFVFAARGRGANPSPLM
ncbi:acyl carrier protein [Shinella sp. M27]|uniref:acyl carrier protein n=1 Tax=Shinella sp. M27 TaxID=3368614 RepID=UPI003BA314C3